MADVQLLGYHYETFADAVKRFNPDGSIAQIAEVMSKRNPMTQDMPVIAGNKSFSNVSTVRAALPDVYIRRINKGVPNSKGAVKQIEDTMLTLEARSSVDIQLLKLYKNEAERRQYRLSEDVAFTEAMTQRVSELLIYGDSTRYPDEFNGFDVRYNFFSTNKDSRGYQVIPAMTPGANTNTTAWLIGWSPQTVAGLYPRGSKAGFQMRDLGENDIYDSDGNKYRGLETMFNWDTGLMLKDYRKVAAVRNIDISKLATLTSDEKRQLIEQFIRAKGRIRNMGDQNAKFVWYMPQELQTVFEMFLVDKNNVSVSRATYEDGRSFVTLFGVPIKVCDAISTQEGAIPENPTGYSLNALSRAAVTPVISPVAFQSATPGEALQTAAQLVTPPESPAVPDPEPPSPIIEPPASKGGTTK